MYGGSLVSRILGWDSDREEVLAAFPGYSPLGMSLQGGWS